MQNVALGQVLLSDAEQLVASGALRRGSLALALVSSSVEALTRLQRAVVGARAHRESLSALMHAGVGAALELHALLRSSACAAPGAAPEEIPGWQDALTELLSALDMAATRAQVYGQQTMLGKLLKKRHSMSRISSSCSALGASGARIKALKGGVGGGAGGFAAAAPSDVRLAGVGVHSRESPALSVASRESREAAGSLDGFDVARLVHALRSAGLSGDSAHNSARSSSHGGRAAAPLSSLERRRSSKAHRVAKPRANAFVKVRCVTCVGGVKVWWGARDPANLRTCLWNHDLASGERTPLPASTGCGKVCAIIATPRGRVWTGFEGGVLRCWGGTTGEPLTASFKACNTTILSLASPRHDEVWCGSAHGNVRIVKMETAPPHSGFSFELGLVDALERLHMPGVTPRGNDGRPLDANLVNGLGKAHNDRVSALLFVAGRDTARVWSAGGGGDAAIRVWDTVARRQALEVDCGTLGAATALAIAKPTSSRHASLLRIAAEGGAPADDPAYADTSRTNAGQSEVVVSCHASGALMVWGKEAAERLIAVPPATGGSPARSLCSCRGLVAVGHEDGHLRVYDVWTAHGKASLVADVPAHNSVILCVCRAGAGLMTSTKYGAIRFWSLKTVQAEAEAQFGRSESVKRMTDLALLEGRAGVAGDGGQLSPRSAAESTGGSGRSSNNGNAMQVLVSPVHPLGNAKHSSELNIGAPPEPESDASSVDEGERSGAAAAADEIDDFRLIRASRAQTLPEHPPAISGTSARHRASSSELDMLATFELEWESMQLSKLIGEGSYGKVYRASWRSTEVAVKVLSSSLESTEADLIEGFRREACLLRRLRHPNVVLLMGVVSQPPNLAIVTEYLHRGSLFDVIQRTRERGGQTLPWPRRLQMAIDVASAMSFLHTSDPVVIHRDLKSSNLLVDRNMNVKVADLGLGRMMEGSMLTASKNSVNSPRWMAPEYLRGEPTDQGMDVFSYGVVLWELLTLQVPWSELSNTWQVRAALEGKLVNVNCS